MFRMRVPGDSVRSIPKCFKIDESTLARDLTLANKKTQVCGCVVAVVFVLVVCGRCVCVWSVGCVCGCVALCGCVWLCGCGWICGCVCVLCVLVFSGGGVPVRLCMYVCRA